MNVFKIALPERSFCGKEFGHSRWLRHVGECSVCGEGWKEYKRSEKERMIREWYGTCGCGCGGIVSYGRSFMNGHSVMTEERRRKRSEYLRRHNPMWEEGAQRKVGDFWRGRRRPNQEGEQNSAKSDEVRRKISVRNPMRDEGHRMVQKWACSTLAERRRRSEVMSKNQVLFTAEVVQRRVDTYTRRLANGEYHSRNRWKTGWYGENGKHEWYDSSYELEQMRQYDREGVRWTKRHGIRIPYERDNGFVTFYVPDFLVKRGSGVSIEEVKGWLAPEVAVKARVAVEYCRQRGWRYLLLVGKERKVCAELSYLGEAA